MIERPSEVDEEIPQDIAIFAPSLAHRVGFQGVVGPGGPAWGQPGDGHRFQPGDLHGRHAQCLPAIACPTLVISRD